MVGEPRVINSFGRVVVSLFVQQRQRVLILRQPLLDFLLPIWIIFKIQIPWVYLCPHAKIITEVISSKLFSIDLKSSHEAMSIEPVQGLPRLNARTKCLSIHPLLWHWVPLVKLTKEAQNTLIIPERQALYQLIAVSFIQRLIENADFAANQLLKL